MGIEQDKEREHIKEQMKYFCASHIQVIPNGVSGEDTALSRLTYIASTKRGAKMAKIGKKPQSKVRTHVNKH